MPTTKVRANTVKGSNRKTKQKAVKDGETNPIVFVPLSMFPKITPKHLRYSRSYFLRCGHKPGRFKVSENRLSAETKCAKCGVTMRFESRPKSLHAPGGMLMFDVLDQCDERIDG